MLLGVAPGENTVSDGAHAMEGAAQLGGPRPGQYNYRPGLGLAQAKVFNL